MKCPRCQQENPSGSNFCRECATPLKAVSPGGRPAPSYSDVTNALSEALEQQTATAEILRVISRSPTTYEPVFDAIVRSASTLCRALDVIIFMLEEEGLRAVASIGPVAAAVRQSQLLDGVALPLTREYVSGRAFIDRRTVHVQDVSAMPDEFPVGTALQRQYGGRGTTLSVPLLRDDTALGVITLVRDEVSPFSEQQVTLLETFARQAVIAIENVRRFNETKEALEQQTATSEILNVISRSPTDVQPVLDTVVEHASRLCSARDAQIFRREGAVLRLVAHHGPIPTGVVGEFTMPLIRGTVNGRAIMEQRPIVVADLRAESAEFPEGSAISHNLGHRSVLSVPLMRGGVAIGTLSVRRAEVLAFTNAQMALLQTFADQAVIAIENVRLFTELQEKNRALTQAHAQVTASLEQQTATGEILRVISNSPTDLRPVFETIVESVVQLCDGVSAFVYRFDGELIHLSAHHHTVTSRAREVFERRYPAPPSRMSMIAQAILDRTIVHVHDFENDPDVSLASREMARAAGHRSTLAVPMLRHGSPIGAIAVGRRGPLGEPRPFSNAEIELLQTFADQAVIAIENVHLFKELEARTDDLTRSVEQLTALGEVGRAVSSTLDLETVLSTIVSRAVQLSGLDDGVVFEYDDAAEEFVQRVATGTDGALAEARRTTRIRKGEGVLGRTAITLEPVQVSDITGPGAYEGRLRENLLESGVRAILAVPMVREGHLIGCLGVTRNRPGEFPAATIDLLRTFATQSALAIQNARLFREIEHKSRELEAASRHKSEFLANMSHELRTPLNAIIGFSEVLSERMFGELNEKQEEYLKDINASGQHLLSLINDILDLSKIEAGRMELEVANVDLPMAIDNALTLVRERAGRRSIVLHMTIDERLGQVQADERKLKQVLLNLLSNAIKFTPEGGRIDVRAALVDGMAEVSVADTGVGIAPEDQDAVFEEFRQVGTAAKKVEGTGLGLTLCRKFIELHGGRIWVQSEVDVGSTFTFTIPMRRVD